MEGRDDEGLLETSEKIEVHQRAAVPHDSQTNQLNIGSRQSSVVISQFSKVHEYEEIFSSLARYCVVTLSNSAVQRVHRNKLTNLGAVHTMWSTLLCGGTALKNQLSLPVCATLSRLCCPVSSHSKAVVLSDQNKTAGLQLSADQLEIRNDTWTFESIRASHGIKLCSQNEYKDSLPMGWYYEVNIKSSSIIQIGFANESCVFQPEKGLGVGDDKNSCAFDGGRCKKWNGSITELEDNNYGEEWSDGDMISCCLSRDGQVSFWLNGKDLGVAFTGLDLSKIWFPAVSVSTEQQVRVNFGSSPFKYAKPDGYASVSCLSKSEMGETGYLEDGQIRDKVGFSC
ncbi:RING finger and SPRY domain-containing protein 1-like [Lingula anatina]|uniref:RING finger and SPRY domain-containing protein 1-like n=1 Tax=Lingula anatina TaxID=7574 RepID=A0A1S3JPR7_LINAN|nr:RING finger and SPRY domain-containing protein 1-like [Lingula anatina]|eukprot:XP_013412358.1 RING finger and SPRY domain-containing protein 1-like [Lingula anatina]